MARLVFLDPHTRELFTDWNAKAREAVAYLRLEAGKNPHDPALASLVGELTVNSAPFAALWSQHPVRDKTHGTRHFKHPLVGALTLEFEALRLPDTPDQLLVTFNAEPRSGSEAALRLLANLSAEAGLA
jgi:hypothetical protein